MSTLIPNATTTIVGLNVLEITHKLVFYELIKHHNFLWRV